MKHALKLLLSLAITVSGSQAASPTKPAAASGYGHIPLHFEPNRGQATTAAKYVAHGGGYSLSFEDTKAVVRLMKPTPARDKKAATKPETTAFEIRLVGANANSSVSGDAVLPGKVNYLIGNDATKWKRDIPTFAKVKYAAVHDGVDLVYYGNQGQLEYDFIVAPGADPSVIALEFAGVEKVAVDEATGRLALHLHGGRDVIYWKKPVSYQGVGAVRAEVSSEYVMLGENKIGFRLGAYDTSKSLTIDPTLVYSTYLGGTGGDVVTAIAADNTGSAYITGTTLSSDFPIVIGAYQDEHKGLGVPYQFWGQFTADPNQTRDVPNAFVSKLSADGRTLIYSTFIGGTGGPAQYQGYGGDTPYGIAVDGTGCAHITGSTFSGDYPVTAGAFMTTGNQFVPGNPNAWNLCAFGFLTKLNADGNHLEYSTYFGGRSVNGTSGGDISLNANNEAVITGFTHSEYYPVTAGVLFPTLVGAISPGAGGVGFLTRFNNAGTGLICSTYLPGSCSGSAISPDGNVCITGTTWTPGFPVTANAYQSSYSQVSTPATGQVYADAYVMVLDPTATTLVYSTLFGGVNTGGDIFGENVHDLAVDGTGKVCIAGTSTTSAFPTTPGAYQAVSPGYYYWAAKFDPAAASGPASLIYSTYLVPWTDYYHTAHIAADTDGNVFVGGNTAYDNIPVSADALQSHPAGVPGYYGNTAGDVFLLKLNPAGSAVPFATYWGGAHYEFLNALTRGPGGDIYLGGYTKSDDFPISPANVFQTTFTGLNGDGQYDGRGTGFVAKIAFPPVAPPEINGGVPADDSIFGTADPLNPGHRTGTISGTGDPGCTVEITISDPAHPLSTANNRAISVTVDVDGNWSLTLTLDDGQPSISVVQVCAGEASEPVDWQVNVDGTPPVIISAPADRTLITGTGDTVPLPDLTSELVASDPSGVAGKTQSIPAGTALAVGIYPVTMQVTDTAGNVSTVVVTITVMEPNTPPTAVDDDAFTGTASILIDVLANDDDADGDALTITGFVPPAGGTVTIENGKLRFTPDGTVSDAFSFSYTVSDGRDSAIGLVTIYPLSSVGNSYACVVRDAAGKPRGLFTMKTTGGTKGSGVIYRDGKKYKFSGNLNTGLTNVTIGGGQPKMPLRYGIGPVDASGKPTLLVSYTGADGTPLSGTATQSPYNAVKPTSAAAKYTMIATGTSPKVAGAIRFTILADGSVSFAGNLGGGLKISGTSQMLAGNRVPVYLGGLSGGSVQALGGDIIIGGTGAVSGTLRWNVAPGADARVSAGVDADYSALGARYVPATTGSGMLAFNSALQVTLTLEVPSLVPSSTKTFNLTVKNNAAGSNPSVKLAPSNGSFTGKYTTSGKTRTFFGVVLQGAGLNYGYGPLLDIGALGSATFTPKP